MNNVDIQNSLNRLGWHLTPDGVLGPVSQTAIRDFQRGYNLGPALTVDGIAGPATQGALANSVNNGGKASAHFAFSEFACRCGGTLPGCETIKVARELLDGLETLRAAFYPSGLTVASGYRCPQRNAQVGGASNSQHMYGNACDVAYAAKDLQVAGLHKFGGIGRSASTHLVRHVDVRQVGPNTTGGTPQVPTIWDYAS